MRDKHWKTAVPLRRCQRNTFFVFSAQGELATKGAASPPFVAFINATPVMFNVLVVYRVCNPHSVTAVIKLQRPTRAQRSPVVSLRGFTYIHLGTNRH